MKLFFNLLFLAFANFSHARGGDGTLIAKGSNAVLCKAASESVFAGFYTLDYLLDYRQSGPYSDLAPIKSWEESQARIVAGLGKLSPLLQRSFLEFSDSLMSARVVHGRQWISWDLTDILIKEAEATKLELLKLQRETQEMKLQTESEIQRKLNEALKAKDSKHESELEALREQTADAAKKSELALLKMKSQVEKDMAAKLAGEFATSEQDLKNQLAERDLKLQTARAEEVELRKSKRELSAELAAIISNVIPPSVSQMGTYEAVWVTKPALAKAMAHTMREQMYNQLIGFKAGLYGDLQGILGKSLPNIANLELDLPPDEI